MSKQSPSLLYYTSCQSQSGINDQHCYADLYLQSIVDRFREGWTSSLFMRNGLGIGFVHCSTANLLPRPLRSRQRRAVLWLQLRLFKGAFVYCWPALDSTDDGPRKCCDPIVYLEEWVIRRKTNLDLENAECWHILKSVYDCNNSASYGKDNTNVYHGRWCCQSYHSM